MTKNEILKSIKKNFNDSKIIIANDKIIYNKTKKVKIIIHFNNGLAKKIDFTIYPEEKIRNYKKRDYFRKLINSFIKKYGTKKLDKEVISWKGYFEKYTWILKRHTIYLSYFNYSVISITYTDTEFYKKWLKKYKREFAEQIKKQKKEHRRILKIMKRRKLMELHKKFKGKKFLGIGIYGSMGGSLKKIEPIKHKRSNFCFGIQTLYLLNPPHYGFNIGFSLDTGYWVEFFTETEDSKYVYKAFNITTLVNLLFATSYIRTHYFLLQFGYSQNVKIDGEIGEKNSIMASIGLLYFMDDYNYAVNFTLGFKYTNFSYGSFEFKISLLLNLL